MSAQSGAPAKHIVDVLIEERCPHLASTPAWPILRPALHAALNYRAARDMADAIAPLGGAEALDRVSALLHLKLAPVRAERLPAAGRCVIVCNHPTGIADGVAIYDLLKTVRDDSVFFANADALRVCAGFEETLIPVEWVQAKRTRERTRVTLKMTEEAIEAGRPIMIFPAGRLARMRNGLLTDPEWMPTAVSLVSGSIGGAAGS